MGHELPETLPVNKSVEHCAIRVFGVNKDGNSVCAHIHNFHGYLWVELQNLDLLPKGGDYEYFGYGRVDGNYERIKKRQLGEHGALDPLNKQQTTPEIRKMESEYL